MEFQLDVSIAMHVMLDRERVAAENLSLVAGKYRVITEFLELRKLERVRVRIEDRS